jgi:hypothetical protein
MAMQACERRWLRAKRVAQSELMEACVPLAYTYSSPILARMLEVAASKAEAIRKRLLTAGEVEHAIIGLHLFLHADAPSEEEALSAIRKCWAEAGIALD